jgi:hypothetical protein
MHHPSRATSIRSTVLAGVGGLVLALPLVAAPTQAADPPWTTVATGLDNPRQLSFTGDTLYVAEAGTGGAGPCVAGAEGGEVCVGLTGAITRVRDGHQSRVLTGLPSLAGSDGGGAIGPADVVVTGQNKYVLTMGLGDDPAVRDELGPAGSYFGTLVAGAFPNAGPRVVADIGAFEADVDPDGQGPDTNPTGLLLSGGDHVMTDSGGNALLEVRGGHASTIATFDTPGIAPVPFPPGQIPVDAVPTGVVVGPDGAYYVSELTGYPFVPGFSRIHRVVPGSAPTVYATGLTNVTDLAWHDGHLYAVQIADAGLDPGRPPIGSLVRVNPGASATTVVGGLFAPYGIAVKGDDAYVTTCAVCPGEGTVIKVPLP